MKKSPAPVNNTEEVDAVMEGDYPDRRMVYFSDMEDVNAKKPALEKIVKEWVDLMDHQKE